MDMPEPIGCPPSIDLDRCPSPPLYPSLDLEDINSVLSFPTIDLEDAFPSPQQKPHPVRRFGRITSQPALLPVPPLPVLPASFLLRPSPPITIPPPLPPLRPLHLPSHPQVRPFPPSLLLPLPQPTFSEDLSSIATQQSSLLHVSPPSTTPPPLLNSVATQTRLFSTPPSSVEKTTSVCMATPLTTPVVLSSSSVVRTPSAGSPFTRPTTRIARPAREVLSADQQRVLDAATKGVSLLVVGSAGTGKAFLLRRIEAALALARGKDAVTLAAATPEAACRVNAVTVDDFLGVPMRDESAVSLFRRIINNPVARGRLLKAKTLIIAEASLLGAARLDLIEEVSRLVRSNSNPFGGIQLVLCADVVQAPPPDDKDAFFKAVSFRKVISSLFFLTTNHRQSGSFAQALRVLRAERFTALAQQLFARCFGNKRIIPEDATTLFGTSTEANLHNKTFLAVLKTAAHEFAAFDIGDAAFRKVLGASPFPERLALKVGALVVLTRTIDRDLGLVQGVVGRVVGFKAHTSPPSAVGSSKKEACDVGDAERSFWEQYHNMPLVDFGLIKRVLIQPKGWKIRQDGQVVCARVQLPLALAWGMAVSRARGLTLDRVIVDLDSIKPANVYSAIGRASRLDGMRFVGRWPAANSWVANPAVLAFLRDFAASSQKPQPSQTTKPPPLAGV